MSRTALESTVRFFTICARRELAQASLLFESLSRHHPNARLTIWLLDMGPIPDSIGESRGLIRSINECISKDTQYNYWLRYDIPEIVDVIKPYCFAKHFEEAGDEIIIYIEAYTYVYGPFTDLLELAQEGASGVLVPRFMTPRTAPIPVGQEGAVFDLGLLALRVSAPAIALLEWWKNWFESASNTKLGNEMAVFQQQINSAPYLWPGLKVTCHKGYQVASWNTPDRQLAVNDNDAIMVGNVPLISFHFGPFDPDDPKRLSSKLDDFDVHKYPVLSSLVARYRRETIARGFWECRQQQRPGLVFTDGARFDFVCYHAYRAALKQGVTFESVIGSGPGSFREWLCKYPIESKFPRYIETLFELRPDVKAVYNSDSFEAVLHWIHRYGTKEMSLEPNVLQRYNSADTQSRSVSYLGYITGEVGLGEAARGYIAALQHQGYSVDLVDISDTLSHKQNFAHIQQANLNGVLAGGIKILHVNADTLPEVIGRIPPAAQRNSYLIGIWAWETLDFPEEWRDRFNMINEIWVSSQFIAKAIAPKTTVPIVVIPHVIKTPDTRPERQLFGIDPDEFVFLLSFDFFSVMERKNPLGAVNAFKKAFTPDEPVRLFVKSMHGDKFLDQYALLKEVAAGARITLYDGTLSSGQRFALFSSCDAYLSLHRAEGFGLGLAECMALGKPVVATGWSGNMDFMTHQNSVLVNFELKHLATNAGPYKAGIVWAEPDIEDAAQKMRQLWLDERMQARIGEQARHDIQAMFSLDTVSKMLKDRLTIIEENRNRYTSDTAKNLSLESKERRSLRILNKAARRTLKKIMSTSERLMRT